MFDRLTLKAARVEQGVTALEMAGAAGVTERQIWRYEAGKTEPSYSVAARMARRLGLDLDSLYIHEPEAAIGAAVRGEVETKPAPTDASQRSPVGA